MLRPERLRPPPHWIGFRLARPLPAPHRPTAASFFRAQTRLEGRRFSLSETPEIIPAQNAHESAHNHDHDHAGHDHTHDHDHAGHAHHHGPVLNPECTRELVLDIPAVEVDKAFKIVTGNYKKYARIPGFRAGKVPESVVKRRFENEIRKEVLDGLLPDRFNQAVLELGVKVVGQPQVTELNVAEGQPLHVKAVFEFVPDFSLDGYDTVTVPRPSVEVTDEEFQQELEHLQASRATMEPVESSRAMKNGDWAEISYKGVIDGEADAAPIEGQNTLVEIGGKDTVEAFTTALKGAKVGQELKAEVVYPADYAEPRLAGKTVAYEVEVKGLKKRILPELNDDFAKELGSYENMEELNTRVREYLTNRKRRTVEGETKDQLFNAIRDKYTFPVPETLVQQFIDERLERGLRALAQQGMTAEHMRKLDLSRLRDAQRDGALAEAKTSILLDRIAEAEKVEITEEELDHEIYMAAMQSRETPEALRKRLTDDGSLARIREQMKREKAAHALYERLPETKA